MENKLVQIVPLRVCLVDDDDVMRGIVESMLRQLLPGAQIAGFSRAPLAYEHLSRLPRERLPHVIISDVRMPEMDGWEFLTALKANEELRHIPVIMVTSEEPDHPETGVRARAERGGAAGYVEKPASSMLHPGDLYASILAALDDTAR